MENTLQQQSAQISCEHMTELAIKQRDFNHFNYITSMTSKETNPIQYNMLDTEHRILKGYVIDKKNCIYKRPQYNSGEWEKQFQKNNYIDPREIFNLQTKQKSKVYHA